MAFPDDTIFEPWIGRLLNYPPFGWVYELSSKLLWIVSIRMLASILTPFRCAMSCWVSDRCLNGQDGRKVGAICSVTSWSTPEW